MSGDLTRWNRAALPRFRYIDGNAATFLEMLRQQLRPRFAQWQDIQPDPPPDETVAERLLRIVKQYDADRRDWGWETSRSFARALHILTEHLDAFANEGYLRTATQLSSVHALAAMIGYAPAPASSATTPLILNAKPDVAAATVPLGFAVKASPPGQPPVIFETLADIDIAFALNTVHLAYWNRNNSVVTAADITTTGFWGVPSDLKASVGDYAVVEAEATNELAAAKIAGTGSAFQLGATAPAVTTAMTRDTVSLRVAPRQTLVPAVNGSSVVWLTAGHGFSKGDLAYWMTGSTTSMAFVDEASDASVRLAEPVSPPGTNVSIYRASPVTYQQYVANGYQWRLSKPSDATLVAFVTSGTTLGTVPLDFEDSGHFEEGVAADKTMGFLAPKPGVLDGVNKLWLVSTLTNDPVADVMAGLPADTLEFTGKPGNIASGDVALLQIAGGGLVASRIVSIDKGPNLYRITFTSGSVPTAGVDAVMTAFATLLRPVDAGCNTTLVSGSALAFDLDPWPAPLTSGRTLILESASGAFDPLPVRVLSIDPPADGNLVHIDETLPGAFTVGGLAQTTLRVESGDLLVRANVADAGHGQTRPVKILGSGDASQTGQTFTIDTSDVSQVRDVSIPGGIRADLLIQVGDEFYSQTANLGDADPADPSFTVSTTETGSLILTFGDGRHGRRLQTGTNNVRMTLRQGSGPAGNLAAGALTDIVRKHPALDSFEQPVAAIGGSAPETLDKIRVNAPGRLAAMDRAISVSDYEQLARRFQGVWHALAYEQIDLGRSREGVAVVVVPAGGGPLGTLAGDIRAYLTANGLPSVDVTIVDYAPVPVEIAITLRVDSSEYDPRDVAARVRAAVLSAFDLSLRAPAQPLYRSEVYRVVTGIEGVANCDVVLFKSLAASEPPGCKTARGKDGSVWTAYPDHTHVVVASDPAKIAIVTAEATV
jgi:hypothetical protein